jgi:predicted enzyme related to lactoylglutathione lyase
MFIGMHALIYAHDADKVRAFFRDVFEWPYVDAHAGWLIFKLPPSEVGVHPIMPKDTQSHQLYLMVEDIKKTVAALEKKGVQCAPVQDAGFGLLTSFELPGGGPMGMYQPRHPMAINLRGKSRTPAKPGTKARRVSGGAKLAKGKKKAAKAAKKPAKKSAKRAAKKPVKKPAKKTAARKPKKKR